MCGSQLAEIVVGTGVSVACQQDGLTCSKAIPALRPWPALHRALCVTPRHKSCKRRARLRITSLRPPPKTHAMGVSWFLQNLGFSQGRPMPCHRSHVNSNTVCVWGGGCTCEQLNHVLGIMPPLGMC